MYFASRNMLGLLECDEALLIVNNEIYCIPNNFVWTNKMPLSLAFVIENLFVFLSFLFQIYNRCKV